jgi:hypothetical protein
LLEAQVTAASQLDPYVIWYAGKNRIKEGRMSEGYNRIIWKVPERAGFQVIRAETFPFQPKNIGLTSNIPGKTRELSLPITKKFEGKGYFAKDAERLKRWYQLWGALQDVKVPDDQSSDLMARQSSPPKWEPYAGNYGLLVGSEETYTLPASSLLFAESQKQDQRTARQSENALSMPVRRQIMLHFVPLSKGTIFSGDFVADTASIKIADGPSSALFSETEKAAVEAGEADDQAISQGDTSVESPTGRPAALGKTANYTGIQLELSYTGEALVLTYVGGEESRQVTIPQGAFKPESFITAVINIQFDQSHFSAGLELETTEFKNGEEAIILPAPISKEGEFRIGGRQLLEVSNDGRISLASSVSGSTKKNSPTAIIGELGISNATEAIGSTEKSTATGQAAGISNEKKRGPDTDS